MLNQQHRGVVTKCFIYWKCFSPGLKITNHSIFCQNPWNYKNNILTLLKRLRKSHKQLHES